MVAYGTKRRRRLGSLSEGAVTAIAVTEGVLLDFRTLPQSKIGDF